MATTATAFSPKEFKVLYKFQSEFGTPASGTNMYQLDVDSISMPSLNPNQTLDIKTSDGRTAKTIDMMKENYGRLLSVKEMTFTGTFHLDTAHKLPLYNILNQSTSSDAINLVSGFQPNALSDASGSLGSHELFTIVIARPLSSNTGGALENKAKNLEFTDCVCTNYQISADSTTDGGLYKFSMTFSTGSIYSDFDDATDVTATAYANSTVVTMGKINAGSLKVFNANHILSSFNVTVDHPAIWTGAGGAGFITCNRGQEASVTFDAQVKYDELGDEHIQSFDTGAVHDNVGLYIENSDNFDISVNDYIITNAALAEGDIMMLDLSGKAIDDGTEALLTLDWTS